MGTMRAMAVALTFAALCPAEWIRVESPGIELLTDAGERSGRQLVERFEQVRAVFQEAGMTPGPLRLRVFVFASAEEFRRYRAAADGFYQSGADRDYIALYNGPEAGRVAFHEYVHLVLRHSSVPLPKWFDEGAAEFYSTLEIEIDRLRIGEPVPAHLAVLARETWLEAAALARHEHGAIFYAESWALVHMLNLAPQWRDGMPHFVSLLAQEKPPEEAFREAFGTSMDQALAALPVYLKSMRSGVVHASLDRPDPPRVDRITDAEAALASAGLALAVSRPDVAKTIAAKVKDSAAAEGMRGAIALAENRPDDARRHFDRAIQLGSRDASLYFEYAMLERESGRPDTELLRKTIQIDPGFADAQFLMGVRETDAGEYRSALEHLRAAVSLHPDRSTYWHALGYAQAKAGDYQNSQVSARRTIASAETDAEEQMGRALLRLSDELPAPRAPRSAVNTPRSWENRKGDARVEGTLVEFDCDGASPRLRIRDRSGAMVTLQVQHPGQIELINAPEATLQLSCGPQDRRVVVEYERASGDVTRIEFRL